MLNDCFDIDKYLTRKGKSMRPLSDDEFAEVVKKWRAIYPQIDKGGFRVKRGLKALDYLKCLGSASIYVFNIDGQGYHIQSADLSLPFSDCFDCILQVDFDFGLHRNIEEPNGYVYFERY